METEMSEQYLLEEILTIKQMNEIIEKWWYHTFNSKPNSQWTILSQDLKPASKELIGFLGVHLKLTLDIIVEDKEHRIGLFVKHVPKKNKPKTEFIDSGNFYRKEMFVYRALEEMDDGRPKSWSKVYLCNEEVVVMPDLSTEGYTTCSKMELMNYDHLKLAVESLARFHAALVDYQTMRSSNGLATCSLRKEYPEVNDDNCFKPCKWLKAAAKLGANILKEFSVKHKENVSRDTELEEKIYKSFAEDCENLKVYGETINVFLHRDLWANNIMYRYNGNKPDRVILIDYQCSRIGPPAYDLTNLFYYNTNKEIRDLYEQDMIEHYFEMFMDSLNGKSKAMVKSIGYSLETVLEWCEKSRSLAILSAVSVFPFILMDGATAKQVFDDPVTFDHYLEVDRSDPVVSYARINQVYKERLLEACEEYYERYIVGKY